MHNHLDVVSHSSKFSGISGCSDAVSHGSASSTKSTDLIIGELFFIKVASDASCCLDVGCFHQKSQLCTLLLNTGIINMMYVLSETIQALLFFFHFLHNFCFYLSPIFIY